MNSFHNLTRKKATVRTVIPLDYDKSEKGFNSWASYIRNEVHVSSKSVNIDNVLEEVDKILAFNKPEEK